MVLPLLDCLIDVPENERYDYRQSVLRDLLWLLNTRRSSTNTEYSCFSVLDYGFPDITESVPPTSADVTKVIDEITKTLDVFEPRLKSLIIRYVDLSQSEPVHALRDRAGTDRNYSANPFFGFRNRTDATGRDIASKIFRYGIVIEAELHGKDEVDFVTFDLLRDDEGHFHARFGARKNGTGFARQRSGSTGRINRRGISFAPNAFCDAFVSITSGIFFVPGTVFVSGIDD
jgi:type VI secretion system lysozyme-like protein